MQEGKWDQIARGARSSWEPGMPQYHVNASRTRPGIPLTLAICGAAICSGFAMFSIKWAQHEEMYPRRPRSLPPRRQVDLETSERTAAEPLPAGSSDAVTGPSTTSRARV